MAGGGVLRISSEGDVRRIFLGLKLSIPGFFGVGESGKYFFVFGSIQVGIFFGHSKQSQDSW